MCRRTASRLVLANPETIWNKFEKFRKKLGSIRGRLKKLKTRDTRHILVAVFSMFFLIAATLQTSNVKATGIPSIKDPTPGYWETSEYMIGSVAVGIIFPESNGTIDPSTEDWTEVEEQQITGKIHEALDWWTSQNPDANVTFVTEFNYRVPTSYELITHNISDLESAYAWDEIVTHLGYPGTDLLTQVMNYLNDLRERFNTDWAFLMDMIDASNDSDGRFPDRLGAHANPGGPYLRVPVKTTEDLKWRVAHEMGHIFWATDEYNGKTEYRGYLNVPDVEGSGGLMWDTRAQDHFLSGKPDGLEGTWGQVGWRDSDGDGIQDIVDTFPRVYVNSPEISQRRVNLTGIAAVTPIQNKNPWTDNPEGRRDVTINKIKQIEFRVDSGNWTPAIPIDGSFGDAIENFTLVTEILEPGNYTIEVRATNQWGNSGYANQTIEVSEFLSTDLNKDGTVNIVDISIVASAYGTKEGDERYNQIADMDDNKEINIVDVSIVALDYGKTV